VALLFIFVRYFDMGLLSGQNTTIENGDKKILELKYMEELSQAMIQKFEGTTYNRYYVMSSVYDILGRTTVLHLIDSLHFTNQEILEFLNLDDVDTIGTTYDIQDPSERGSFIKVITHSEYAKMVLNGDYRISVDMFSKHNYNKSVLVSKLSDDLFKRVKRALLGVRLRFSERFRQEACDYVFRKFGYIQ
jgi:hypothetical protein